MQINPDYYIKQLPNGTTIDVFDVAETWDLNYPRGNALKYLLRAGKKPGARGADDLRKAIRCLERELELEIAAEERLKNGER